MKKGQKGRTTSAGAIDYRNISIKNRIKLEEFVKGLLLLNCYRKDNMKFLLIAALVAVATATPTKRGGLLTPESAGPVVVEGLPVSVGPAVVDQYEPISVGPAIVDEHEEISVGPAVVDEYEPISVGPAVVDEYEPISVGPAVVDEYEPISVGPALIDGPIPDPAAISGSPLVQVIVNVNTKASAGGYEPIQTEPVIIDPMPEHEYEPIQTEPVIIDPMPEHEYEPIQTDPAIIDSDPAVNLPDILN
ncbi:unnamed protein product [Colias eurytheme]|nr:unnamed protein product [Colias eurytheme]